MSLSPQPDETIEPSPVETPFAAAFDAERDLSITRIIRAPRAIVWRAWTDPDRLARWWIPAPMTARVERLELVPGGALITSMSEGGRAFEPHMNAVFVTVEASKRIVFTNALDAQWRPASPAPVAVTAEFTLTDHPEGTAYRATARHASADDRARHEELGFVDGWTMVTAALAALVEREV
ncbi:SRPBCC domain-containing protein [Leucobacter sp. USHLN154]|uniref:SRPBCC domain-containing protein n=1 Tax=Leucobacter sp. USHLN154 TaxID=3081269 RepID=UPI003019049C